MSSSSSNEVTVTNANNTTNIVCDINGNCDDLYGYGTAKFTCSAFQLNSAFTKTVKNGSSKPTSIFTVSVDGSNCDVLDVSMNGGTTFKGSLTSNNNLTVSGTSSLKGGATVTGGSTTDSLLVSGTSSLKGGATVTGGATTDSLVVNGTSSLKGGATVTGGATTDSLVVNGTSSLKGGATVTGGATTDSLVVNGKASLNSGATVKGGLTVDNLTVSGSNSFVPAGTIISYVCKNKPSNPTTSDNGATYTGGNAPVGYLWCDGSSLTTSGSYNGVSNAFMNLYNTVGTIYGGTGTGFNLPNLQGAFLRGCGGQDVSGNNGCGTSVNIRYNGPSAPGNKVSTIDVSGNSSVKCKSDGGIQPHATQQHDHCFIQAGDTASKSSGGGEQMLGANGATHKNPIVTTTSQFNSSWLNTSNVTTVPPETVFVDTVESRPFNYGVYYLIKY